MSAEYAQTRRRRMSVSAPIASVFMSGENASASVVKKWRDQIDAGLRTLGDSAIYVKDWGNTELGVIFRLTPDALARASDIDALCVQFGSNWSTEHGQVKMASATHSTRSVKVDTLCVCVEAGLEVPPAREVVRKLFLYGAGILAHLYFFYVTW